MTLFLEEPLPAILIGLLAVAILGGLWIRTGRKWLLHALAVSIVATAAMLLLEKWWVTYREQVDATLRQCAADVENNDLQAVLSHVHSEAPAIRQRVEEEFPKYRFKEVTIARNLEIAVEAKHDPPQAVAEFNVIAVGAEKGGLIANQKVVRFVKVVFQREKDGQWRVIDYAHHDPTYGFRTRDRR
jgi:ketosteroid isomerase-like protein